ncbi:CST complex subunit CTC1 [Caerostris darwini]|uniref:CST complex subunit CTC1 n=1 Tax=Caerostris darwini TaxID=1538125 RepID=A0AAV4SZB7_9ARAC|nr:CST complex subunit CTC1 [Caerostris darwini]
MEVNGLIVAASERLSLENDNGFLFTVYNADIDIHFCILASNISTAVWKNLVVNHYYKFTNLKVGALQTSLGGKVILLKTTSCSTYAEIDHLQNCKFEIAENLKAVISDPRTTILSGNKSIIGSNLITYQGFVTKVKDWELKIYELDSKVSLYTTFNIYCAVLEKGSEVIISNVHCIKDSMGSVVLVCCGLSSVREINPIKAKRKIFLFTNGSDFLRNVLEYFLNVDNKISSKKLSLPEEYFSEPHRCFPFSENQLPTYCDVPYLSDILDEVTANISWILICPKWKIYINSQENLVIIGMLYLSTSGTFYIADQTLELPVIFTQECENCLHENNIIKDFENKDIGFMIAVQEYDIIFENISCKNEDFGVAEYHGVKEILSKGVLSQNSVITCILYHKEYKDVEILNDGISRKKLNATLSLIVRDVFFQESTISVYLPYISENIFGLLPGAVLELHGFLCFCSQNSNFYLRPSSKFGIEIKKHLKIVDGRHSFPEDDANLLFQQLTKISIGNIFHLPFNRICFILKIISAEVFSVCKNCNKNSREKCCCLIPRKVKVKVSALIDDGNQPLLAHCCGEAAKKLLNFTEKEWQDLASYVECSNQPLKFSDKKYNKIYTYLSFINQIFSAYCSSKATCRKLLFNCIYIPNTNPPVSDINSVWCKRISDIVTYDHIKLNFMKLKNIGKDNSFD